jgi:hypothetical protein
MYVRTAFDHFTSTQNSQIADKNIGNDSKYLNVSINTPGLGKNWSM